MASRMLSSSVSDCLSFIKTCSISFVRHGHRLRGKAPGVARSLEQRLIEKHNVVIPELSKKVNIGFPMLKPAKSKINKERLAHVKSIRSNPEMEKLARNHKLEVNLDAVREEWLKTSGPFHIRKIAEHYGVFEHLFGDAYFIPRLNIDISYNNHSVYYGNILKPQDLKKSPLVRFNDDFDYGNGIDKNALWTLIMTNPDGNLLDSNKECVHWFISNIPSGEHLDKGQEIAPYLPPIPPRGTGYHRHIFILYKQEKELDFDEFKIIEPYNLNSRSFSSMDFYRKFQDDITPAGLAFYQSDWDPTVTDFYHSVLHLKEPIFEYDFPTPFLREQEWFPKRRPFNIYMDRYRDPFQVNKEYLEEKLAKSHPFHGPEESLKFPNAHPIKGVPSWLKREIKKKRLGWGRINEYL